MIDSLAAKTPSQRIFHTVESNIRPQFSARPTPFFAEERNGGTYPWNDRGEEKKRGIQGGVAKERERNAGLHGCETSRWACVAALPTLRIRGSSHSPRWLDEISFAIVCDRLKKQYDDEEEKDTFSRNFHPYIWRRNWRGIVCLYLIILFKIIGSKIFIIIIKLIYWL